MPQPTAAILPSPGRMIAALLVTLVCLPSAWSQQPAKRGDYLKRLQACMELKKQLVKDPEAATKAFRRSRIEFRRLMLRGTSSAAEEKKLFDGIRHSLLIMAEPSTPRHELPTQRQDFLRLINGNAGTNGAGHMIGNPNAKRRFRAKVLNEVVQGCKLLLDNNFYVRVQAIAVLGSLDAQSGRGTATPYVGSLEPLINIVQDNQQFDPLKALAVRGLRRHIRYAGLGENDEMRIAATLAGELERTETDAGYQELLATVIADLHYTFEIRGQGRPVALMACANCLTDKTRDWNARARAAFAIGRTGDAGAQIDWKPLAYHIAELAHEAGTKYNAGDKNVIDHTFGSIFFAFSHETRAEQTQKLGLLNRSGDQYIKDAYSRTLPLVKVVVFHYKDKKKIDDKDLVALRQWLDANPPANMAYHAKAPPLPKSSAGPSTPKTPGDNTPTD